MRVDESGAPWPYQPPPERDDDPGTPTWECPEDVCVCGPLDASRQTVAYTIVLFDERGERLPGARCRVLRNGILLNRTSPHADGGGGVTVDLRAGTTHLIVEWAPADVPVDPRYPFRCEYFVDLGESREEAARRRLHNLGFCGFPLLVDNVQEFQRRFLRRATGNWEDIEGELAGYHDHGLMPPYPDQVARPVDTARLDVDGRPDPPSPPPVPPPPPPVPPSPKPPGGGPPLPAPCSGSAAPGSTSTFEIELRIATPVKLETGAGASIYTAVANARILFDFTNAAPAVPALTPVLTDADGKARVQLPVVTGTVVLGIRSPPEWESPTGLLPAGPELTDTIRDAMDRALDGVPDRARLYERRRDIEHEMQRLEMELTELTATGQGGAHADALSERLNELLYIELPTVRRALRDKALDATDRYANDVPAFFFRPFWLVLHPVCGRVLLNHGSSSFGDPAFAIIREIAPNRIVIDWLPDWVRAPAYRFAWQRPVAEAAIVDPDKGLGGEPCLVLHSTGGDPQIDIAVRDFAECEEAESFERGRDDDGDKSIHYVVDRSGHAVKFIDERFEAYHANPGVWERHKRINTRAVGIEMINTPGAPTGPEFTPAQVNAVKRLVREITKAYPRIQWRVIGHGEVAHDEHFPPKVPMTPDQVRRQPFYRPLSELTYARLSGDPGRYFDWAGLADEGLTFPRVPGLPVTSGRRAAPGKIVEIKRLMLSLGYSVSGDNRTPGLLTDAGDTPFVKAYHVFRYRWQPDPLKKPADFDPPDDATADLLIAGLTQIVGGLPPPGQRWP